MLIPSGFPISDGTEVYINSKQPFITAQTIEQIKGIFGLVMSLLSVALVVFKWFKAPDDAFNADDVESDSEDDEPSVSDHLNSISTNFSKLE